MNQTVSFPVATQNICTNCRSNDNAIL